MSARLVGLLAVLAGCAAGIPRGPVAALTALQPPASRVLAEPDAANVYLSVTVLAGSSQDPIGGEGTASLLAAAMAEGGAGGRDAAAVQQELYLAGTELEVITEKDQLTFRLRCHKDHTATCMALLRDIVVSPALEPEVVERARAAAVHLAQGGVADDEEALAWEVLDDGLFEGRPYGHPTFGRWGALATLGRDALVAFHADNVRAQRVTLGVAGPVEPASAEAWIASFGPLAGEPVRPIEPLLRPPTVRGRSMVVVETGSPVVGFRLGHPLTLVRGDRALAALQVAMTAFGSHRQSFGRLFRELRGARGLNYGDYAYVEPYRERALGSEAEQGVVRRQSVFHMWLRPTSVANAPFALKLGLAELEALVADGLTQDELDSARSWMLGAMPLWNADPGSRLASAVEAAAGGWPDQRVWLPEVLPTLTLDEVNAALRAHLHPDDLKIVAVGSAEGWVDALLGEAPTPMIYDAVTPDAAQAARDAEVAARSAGLTAATVHVRGVADLFR